MTIALPPDDVFPKPYTALDEVDTGFTSFYLVDSDLNKAILPVPPNSSFLEGGLCYEPLTESNEVIVNEFFEGILIFFFDPGRALMSGKKPSPDFISGSEVF